MKERPILMSGPMVRACLREHGPKSQTRRVLRIQPHEDLADTVHYDRATGGAMWASSRGDHGIACPYGSLGDLLWVRETYTLAQRIMSLAHTPCYMADEGITENNRMADGSWPWRWKPAIHMKREHCRLVLEVTGVRVERLQDITNQDAKAEGVYGTDWGHGLDYGGDANYVPVYRELWDSLNAKRGYGWATNPWVWVVEFKRAQ